MAFKEDLMPYQISQRMQKYLPKERKHQWFKQVNERFDTCCMAVICNHCNVALDDPAEFCGDCYFRCDTCRYYYVKEVVACEYEGTGDLKCEYCMECEQAELLEDEESIPTIKEPECE